MWCDVYVHIYLLCVVYCVVLYVVCCAVVLCSVAHAWYKIYVFNAKPINIFRFCI